MEGKNSELSANVGRGPPKKISATPFTATPLSYHAYFVTKPLL